MINNADTHQAIYKATWLYDGVCILCDGAIQYALRHEKSPNIRFVTIQSDEGRALARQYGVDPNEPDTFIFISNDKALIKSDGVIELSTYLRGITSIVRFGWIIPKPIRDWLYLLVASNRYKLFGKKQECRIPDEKHRTRFVI